jgi:transcriptional regulator with XRE-family HTH domain
MSVGGGSITWQVMETHSATGYFQPMTTTSLPSFGDLLREWRQRRRVSQLELALDADVSSRHLSFVETGRSQPSREMVLRLAEQLEVPLRERNRLLVAAGYAPVFPERALSDPALQAARKAIDLVLAGHEPYPALAVDRHWTLIAANAAVTRLLAGIPADMMKPPVNVLRLSLHPNGLAPRIANLPEWRAHILARLRHQIDISADPILAELLTELSGYKAPARLTPVTDGHAGVVVPFRLRTDAGVLSFISTTTVFGTPVDITLAELALEAFFPADAATAEALHANSDE